MDEIQYGQTVAAEEEWRYEQEQRRLMDAEDARQAMQEERIRQDRAYLLRQIGFGKMFKEKK